MEIEGIVHKLLDPVKGTSARGEWTKQEVIIEQSGEFGRKVCVSFWGDKALDAASLREGEPVTVSVNAESREFNNRWYTEIRVWKIVRKDQQQGTPAGAAIPARDFPPMPTSDPGTSGSGDFDDLPF